MAGLERPLERREFSRQTLTLAARASPRAVKPGGTGMVDGSTRDVNNVGVYFWTEAAFSIGQPLRLTLAVPAEQGCTCRLEIHCEAVVTRLDLPTEGNGRAGVAVRIVRFGPPIVFRSGADGKS